MAETPFPLTRLEQLPLMIDHEAIERAYLPFLLDGEAGARAWKSDYARRRRRALTRMMEPVWATDDFPQGALLGSPLVLARKRGADKL